MSGIARLFTQSVTLSTFTGSGAYGDVYSDPTTVPCYIEDSNREVRNAQGDQVVSTARLFAGMNTAPDSPAVAGQFAVGSKVTVNGRDAWVLSVARMDGAGPARAHHVEVSLT